MKFRWKYLAWWVLGLALIAFVWDLVLAQIDSVRGWTETRLESSIENEVPADADRALVEAWFDCHRIEHTFFERTANADMVGHDSIPTLAGLKDEDLGGMVRGFLREKDAHVGYMNEANVGYMNNGTLSVYFFLDKQGKVVGHYIYPFIYSL
jgi:hypothetical protein